MFKRIDFRSFFIGGIICIILIFILSFLLGFKYTYSPQLNNDWEAISSVGTWATGILSAIITAYIFYRQNQFERRITEREERIALFDKRYAVYNQAKNWIELAKSADASPIPNTNENLFLTVNFSGLDRNAAVYLELIKIKANEIRMAKFCYEKTIYEPLIEMCTIYSDLIFELIIYGKLNKADELTKDLIKSCDQIKSLGILEQMERVLVMNVESER